MLTALVMGLWIVRIGMAWDDTRARKLAAALRGTVARSGRTMLRVSQDAERDQGQVTRQVACEEGLGRTLASQDDTFLQWLGLELACRFGVPRDVRVGQRLRRARSVNRKVRVA